MKKILALIIGLGLLITAVPVGAEQIGGDMGEYIVYCNVDGAEVYFNEEYKGLTEGGILKVPVYTTGTPYNTIVIKKMSFKPYTAQILEHPVAGQTVELHTTLENELSLTDYIILCTIGGIIGLIIGYFLFFRENNQPE